MKKYIQRKPDGTPGTRWHTSPRCITIKAENTVASVPDALLRSYGITQKCEMCERRDQKEASTDRGEDIRKYHPLISVASLVVSVNQERVWLRDELSKRGIYFSLRESKQGSARKLLMAWCREGNFSELSDILREAEAHWQERIDLKDRHKPAYYRDMLSRTLRARDLLSVTLSKGA